MPHADTVTCYMRWRYMLHVLPHATYMLRYSMPLLVDATRYMPHDVTCHMPHYAGHAIHAYICHMPADDVRHIHVFMPP
jgi:hypothetical protein